MPFELKNSVYVVTVCDTGEVTEIPVPQRNTISYDELTGSGDHHDDDLRLIPFEGRVYKADYYYVIRAKIDGKRRVHETTCIRNGRGRIFTKKSKSSR